MIAFTALIFPVALLGYILIVGSATGFPIYLLLLFEFISLPLQVKMWLKTRMDRWMKTKCFLMYAGIGATWWVIIVSPELHRVQNLADLTSVFSGILFFGVISGFASLKYLQYQFGKIHGG